MAKRSTTSTVRRSLCSRLPLATRPSLCCKAGVSLPRRISPRGQTYPDASLVPDIWSRRIGPRCRPSISCVSQTTLHDNLERTRMNRREFLPYWPLLSRARGLGMFRCRSLGALESIPWHFHDSWYDNASKFVGVVLDFPDSSCPTRKIVPNKELFGHCRLDPIVDRARPEYRTIVHIQKYDHILPVRQFANDARVNERDDIAYIAIPRFV
mmetsp:Transcript_10025/g.20726  ORF Transcript_10025/g.20726 Transcript_10025/m.20726 type:complete len:211 (-) Transcript_10025:1506-2138(-)